MIQTTQDKKILVIEDDKSLRKAILEKITLYGFHCVGSADGEEGTQIALEMKPDLVILDLLMPKMDGMTVLKVYGLILVKTYRLLF
jgi:DNA-binding response OmpR family regulator